MNQISLDTDPNAARIAELLEQYFDRIDAGENLAPSDWINEHPEDAESLREHLKGLELLRLLAADSDDLPGVGDPPLFPSLSDYEIKSEIGRGGMGIVYEAWQKSLGRKVALKILPFAAALDERQVARFSIEAQAAAQLRHANIVPVHAVGCERGIHFYSMQLINGKPLDQIIEAARRDIGTNSTAISIQPPPHNSVEYIRKVAEYGVQVAKALHHAHEFGVIHRDVKPSNLILDESGNVWVTDFGLARCQTDASITITGALLGTIRYMSPEQANGNGEIIDHRTDIYSLGVTLYELLTLQRLFETENREAFLHSLRHDEPIPPTRLNRLVPTAFENVLLKSLSKNRNLRYDSAAEMANDLQRFLDGKPTLAKAPTWSDRASRWMLRHKSFVISGILLLLTITFGAGLFSFFLIRQANKTTQALEFAQKYFRKAHGAVNHFGMMTSERLGDIPELTEVREEFLRDAVEYYQEFVNETADDPKLEADLALACCKLGELLEQIGDQNAALLAYDRGEKTYSRLRAKQVTSRDIDAEYGRCLHNLASLQVQSGNRDAAKKSFLNAIQVQEAIVQQSSQWTPTLELARTLGSFGQLLWDVGDRAEADATLDRAYMLLKLLADRYPNETEVRRELAVRCNNNCFLHSDSFASATRWSDLAIAALSDPTDTPNGDPTAVGSTQSTNKSERSKSSKLDGELAVCWNNRALIIQKHGDRRDAQAAFEKVVQLYQRLIERCPTRVSYREELAAALNNLARLHHDLGHWSEANRSIDLACQVIRELNAAHPASLAYRNSLVGILCNRGMMLERTSRREVALAAYGEAVQLQRQVVEQSPNLPNAVEYFQRSLQGYHRLLVAVGRSDDAEKIQLELNQLGVRESQEALGDTTNRTIRDGT